MEDTSFNLTVACFVQSHVDLYHAEGHKERTHARKPTRESKPREMQVVFDFSFGGFANSLVRSRTRIRSNDPPSIKCSPVTVGTISPSNIFK